MPKLKSSTVFSHRGFAILLMGDKSGMIHGDMVISPIVEEFRKYIPKLDLNIIHITDTENNHRSVGSVSPYLKIIHELMTLNSPTLIQAPRELFSDISGNAQLFITYIDMLIMSMGGFIIDASTEVSSEHILEANKVFPVIKYNTIRDSWSDVSVKVDTLIKKMIMPDIVNYYTLISSLSGRIKESNSGVCLGDISRMWVDFPNDSTKLTTIINVAGETDSPITIDEFSAKIWDNPNIDSFSIQNTLIARSPSAVSKMVLNELITKKNTVSKQLKVVNI